MSSAQCGILSNHSSIHDDEIESHSMVNESSSTNDAINTSNSNPSSVISNRHLDSLKNEDKEEETVNAVSIEPTVEVFLSSNASSSPSVKSNDGISTSNEGRVSATVIHPTHRTSITKSDSQQKLEENQEDNTLHANSEEVASLKPNEEVAVAPPPPPPPPPHLPPPPTTTSSTSVSFLHPLSLQPSSVAINDVDVTKETDDNEDISTDEDTWEFN